MKENFVLAYDLGTSGVKGALVNPEGEVRETSAEEYPLLTPGPFRAEQDPEAYWQGVCRVTRQVLEKAGVSPNQILGIVFGTQWKGIIPVGRDGKVLHNSIIWLDARAADQAERLNREFGKNLFAAADYWPKLMWLKENCPECIIHADAILEANGFLKWKATGVCASDISNCFTRSCDPEMDRRYGDILHFMGLPRDLFPHLMFPQEKVGRLTAKAAGEMGLSAGVPVFGGNSDIQGIAVGSGCASVGDVHAYFGSSGWVGYTIPHTAEEIYIAPFEPDKDIYIYGMQAIGLSLNQTIRMLYGNELKQLGGSIYELVNCEAAQVPAGSGNVLATPWFYGERPPLFGENARGCFLNLGPEHDRRHMVRAMMEGVCLQLKMGSLNEEHRKGLLHPELLRVSGGGAASDLWMQILADVMEMPVCAVPQPRHAGAVGTAISALIGLGIYRDFRQAAGSVRTERRFEPDPENSAIYRKSFRAYEGLYASLEPLFSGMNTTERM